MPLFVSTVTSQSWTQRTSSLWPSTCLPASEPASSLRYMLIAQVSVAQWLCSALGGRHTLTSFPVSILQLGVEAIAGTLQKSFVLTPCTFHFSQLHFLLISSSVEDIHCSLV